MLASNATPGTYAWPLALNVRPPSLPRPLLPRVAWPADVCLPGDGRRDVVAVIAGDSSVLQRGNPALGGERAGQRRMPAVEDMRARLGRRAPGPSPQTTE